MVVKVYGVIISPYVQIVILTLKEIGIPFEVVPIDPTSGQNKAPEYLAKQPFGQIPVLVSPIYSFNNLYLSYMLIYII